MRRTRHENTSFENISRRIKLETEKTLPTANTTNMQEITMEAPGNRTREKNIKFSMSELRETAEAQSKNTRRSGWEDLSYGSAMVAVLRT